VEAKVQLVRCPVDDPSVAADQWNMPLDLLVLADAVSGECDVEIVDGTLLGLAEVRRRLTSGAPVVGFTFTALSAKTLGVLTTECKTRGSFVVVGGQPATGAWRSLVLEPSIDAVCVGDGTPVMRAVARQLARGRLDPTQLPNVVTRTSEGTVVTTREESDEVWSQGIPPRNLGGLDPDRYLSRYPATNTLVNMGGKRAVNTFSKRGCPFGCSFCARQDKRIRLRNPRLMASEIRALVDAHGIDYVLDTSDTWFHAEWAKEFAAERVAWGLKNVRMMVFADSRHITPSACRLMSACGVDSVLLGVESGSERILRLNSKETTRESILRAVDWLVAEKIRVSCSFVLGLLGEDEASLAETLSLCELLTEKPNVLCYGNVIMPLMGSRLWSATFPPSRPWPSFITRAIDYDLKAARELYVREATHVEDVSVLQCSCESLLHLGGLECLEYAR